VSIKISGLTKFQLPTNEELAFAIAQKGKDIADGYYAGEAVNVIVENGNPAKVVAEGTQVRYLEYGTGLKGEESGYDGNLPTEPIVFESPDGELQTTSGWEYNYPNPQTKVTLYGQTGWYYNGEFTTGKPAAAQMWRTAEELHNEYKTVIADEIKNKLGGSNAL